MLGAGDPHLRAEQPVGAVVSGFGAGGDVGQRRAGLRLRERHRAREAAGEHRLDEGVDLLVGAELGDQVGVGDGQHQVAGGADVGREIYAKPACATAPEAVRRRGSRPCGQPIRSACGERVERLLDLADDGDAGAVEGRLVGVALLVVRGEVLLGQLLAEVQHAVERLAGVLGEAAALGQLVDPQPFVEQEVEVAARQQRGLHRMVLTPPSTGMTVPVT